MTRLSAISFFCAALLMASPSHAQDEGHPIEITREQAEKECAPYPEVPINIYPVFDEAKYDYTLTLGALQGMGQDAARNLHGGHRGLTLGLTRYEPMLEFRVPVRAVTFPDSLSCVRVSSVDLTIGYRNVTVYIPKDVPQGSCGFEQVMAHEQKHIEVNRAILDEYAPMIVKKLQDYLRYNGVLRERNQQYAVDTLTAKLRGIVDDMSQKMFDENSRRQHLVDTPQEYAKVSATCNGQLGHAAQNFYRGDR